MNFVVQNKDGMIRDQIEIFRRGFLDLPQAVIPADILDQAAYPDFELLDLFIKDFPAAYVIPPDGPMQLSSHQPAKLIAFLLHNGVQVEKATQDFMLEDTVYPKGTYVIWMDQPKRGLANTLLEDGLNVSDLGIEDLVFYSPPTAWSHPLLWGVHRGVMQEKMAIKTSPVNNADKPKGSLEEGFGGAYAYQPTSVEAFQATNALIDRGIALYRAPEAFLDRGREYAAGTLIVFAEASVINEMVNQWGLELSAIDDEILEELVMLTRPRIAVYGDEGVRYCLETLGFDYTEVSRNDLNAGAVNIDDYDIFLNRNRSWGGLNGDGQTAMDAFFAAGGDYVGLLRHGPAFALDAGIADADIVYDYNPDAIIKIDYNPTNGIAAGFWETDYAYVLGASWFTSVAVGTKTVATIAYGDFLTAGFWPDWEISGAEGMPVIIHQENGEEGIQDTILIGIDATFRGHPENTFRLIGNAIFSAME
jgi:hypothetical protein